MIYLIQGRWNVKNIGSGQAYVVGEAKVKSIAIENNFLYRDYTCIFRIMYSQVSDKRVSSLNSIQYC